MGVVSRADFVRCHPELVIMLHLIGFDKHINIQEMQVFADLHNALGYF